MTEGTYQNHIDNAVLTCTHELCLKHKKLLAAQLDNFAAFNFADYCICVLSLIHISLAAFLCAKANSTVCVLGVNLKLNK